ncbi:hypothetical protein ACQUW6_32095 [Bacillus thuringiensis]|uniref:hypothetical protein n=1 Tax=Bacillus thuringiensis TaxID=1428 RepID=UPI003D128A7D
MANRPTQAKQKREIDKLQKDYCQLNIRVQTVEEEMKKVRRRAIIRMLQEKTLHKSARYKYTYEEIAEEMGYSSTTVANIAKEEGLSRRISVVD